MVTCLSDAQIFEAKYYGLRTSYKTLFQDINVQLILDYCIMNTAFRVVGEELKSCPTPLWLDTDYGFNVYVTE